VARGGLRKGARVSEYSELELEEQAHGRTIDERDALQDFASDVVKLVTGDYIDWSIHFGLSDAIEVIDVTLGALHRDLKSANEKLALAEAALNWLDRKMMSSPDMGGNHHYAGSMKFRLNDDNPMAAYWRSRE